MTNVNVTLFAKPPRRLFASPHRVVSCPDDEIILSCSSFVRCKKIIIIPDNPNEVKLNEKYVLVSPLGVKYSVLYLIHDMYSTVDT